MNPKSKRFWLETVMLGTVVACAVALLVAALASGSTVAAGAAPPQLNVAPRNESLPDTPTATLVNAQHFEGMVSCSRCGAKHSSKLELPATQCAVSCVREGASFVLIDGEKTYQLDGDLSVLKRLAGQRADIVGVVRGNTIKVSSIASAT